MMPDAAAGSAESNASSNLIIDSITRRFLLILCVFGKSHKLVGINST